MIPYPFSYFSSLFSPRKMFENRTLLTLWQRLFTTVFLVALLVIPSSLQTLQLKTYPLENFIGGVYEPLTDEVVADIAAHTTLSGEQLMDKGATNSAAVTFGDTLPTSPDFSFQFQAEKLMIRKGKTPLAELSYKSFTESDFKSKEALTTAISRVWYQENRLPISLSITLVSACILGANFLFILLGATFFLYLTKKSKFFHFHTWRECANFSLNCLGLPTILACLVGLLGQPLTTVITVQNILFVLVLLWVFFKTRFRDEK